MLIGDVQFRSHRVVREFLPDDLLGPFADVLERQEVIPAAYPVLEALQKRAGKHRVALAGGCDRDELGRDEHNTAVPDGGSSSSTRDRTSWPRSVWVRSTAEGRETAIQNQVFPKRVRVAP